MYFSKEDEPFDRLPLDLELLQLESCIPSPTRWSSPQLCALDPVPSSKSTSCWRETHFPEAF